MKYANKCYARQIINIKSCRKVQGKIHKITIIELLHHTSHQEIHKQENFTQYKPLLWKDISGYQ